MHLFLKPVGLAYFLFFFLSVNIMGGLATETLGNRYGGNVVWAKCT